MKAFAVGALGLVLLQLALASPATAPRLGQAGTLLSHAVARFVDPTVPLIGSTANTASTTTSPAAPAGVQLVSAPTGPQVSPGMATYTNLT